MHKLLEVLKKRKPLLDEASTVLSVLGAPYLSTPITPFYAVAATALSAAVSASAEYSASQSQVPVSRTNVQVEGVDEPDIVKNSDRFIAVAVGERIYIVNAASNRVASTLNLTSIASSSASKPLHLYAQGMLHTATGLAIIASPGAAVEPMLRISALVLGYMPLVPQETLVVVVDVSDIYSPRVLKVINVSGVYVDARLSNGYAYIVTSSPAYSSGGEPVIPLVNGAYTTTLIVDRVPERD